MSELNRIIKQFNGNVLGIGLDEKILKQLNKNNKIMECNLLNSVTKGRGYGFSKTIKIKKIRKYFKKKSVNFILCNYEVMSKYLNSFVKNSIYLNDFKIYYYGDCDVDRLIRRYSRYDTKINVFKEKNIYILEIDCSNAKNNFFKEKLYSVVDLVDNAIEVIGDILMN